MPQLPAGTHTVDAVGCYMTESKQGTMGLVFQFKNSEGTIECTRWVTPKTSERVLADLEMLGYGKEHLETIEGLDKIGDVIFGNTVSIVVEDEEYNGSVTAKVKWINPTGGKRVTAASSKAKMFAMLTGKAVATFAPVNHGADDGPPNLPIDGSENVPF